jgi:hypothetical protein
LTKAEDCDWIRTTISEDRIKLSGLLISLLEPFDRTPEVHAFLMRMWKTASPDLKSQLIWRILDMPSLPNTVKQDLFDFILAEWEIFNCAAAKFLAKNASVIDQVRERLNDPRWPEKKWIYLCRAVQPEPDRTAVRQLLLEHSNGRADGFTRHVANVLLHRFFGYPAKPTESNQKEIS